MLPGRILSSPPHHFFEQAVPCTPVILFEATGNVLTGMRFMHAFPKTKNPALSCRVFINAGAG